MSLRALLAMLTVMLTAHWHEPFARGRKMARAMGIRSEAAEFSIGALFGILILMLLLSSLVVEVAFNAQTAQANSSVVGATDTLVGLLALTFIAIPLIAIYKKYASGKGGF